MSEKGRFQSINRLIKQVEQLLDDDYAKRQMQPGAYEAFKKIKEQTDTIMNGYVANEISTIKAAVQALDYNQRWHDLKGRVTNEEETFGAEIGRRAVLSIAAEEGDDLIIREACYSPSPVVKNSLKEVVKAETFSQTRLTARAPHIAKLEIDDDGNVSQLDGIDWLSLGLGIQQLGEISLASAEDMEKWFESNLPKARADHTVGTNMKNYSKKHIEQAVQIIRVSNPHVATVLNRIAQKITANLV